MEIERGVIRNREQATQVRDFSGLIFGTITPTDIDGLIEYHNLCYIFIETKFGKSELPDGQRLAFKRLCDDLHKIKPTLFIVASHNSDGDIDVANTIVVEYRWKKEWKIPSNQKSVRELINSFINWVDK